MTLTFTVELTKSFTSGALKGIELVDTVNFPTESTAKEFAFAMLQRGTVKARAFSGTSDFEVLKAEVIAHPVRFGVFAAE